MTTSIKKPALPDTPKANATFEQRFQFESGVKETLEILTGRRAGKISPLSSDATLADAIEKINELVARLM